VCFLPPGDTIEAVLVVLKTFELVTSWLDGEEAMVRIGGAEGLSDPTELKPEAPGKLPAIDMAMEGKSEGFWRERGSNLI